MAFDYVPLLDAVGTLYQEACVKWADSDDPAEEAKWGRAVNAIKECWPELCTKSVQPPDCENLIDN